VEVELSVYTLRVEERRERNETIRSFSVECNSTAMGACVSTEANMPWGPSYLLLVKRCWPPMRTGMDAFLSREKKRMKKKCNLCYIRRATIYLTRICRQAALHQI